MLGAMVSMLPHRRLDLSRMILPGMVGGTIACLLTGCFAGEFSFVLPISPFHLLYKIEMI